MEKLKNRNIVYYVIILLLGLVLCTPLITRGFINTQDSIYHVTRTIGTVTALKDGQMLPLVTHNFVNGFGYSWNLFYPPLANYLMILVKVVTFSYAAAMNALVILSVIFSGITMFWLMKEVIKLNKIAILTAILYMTAPYHMVDIYIRMALGEILAFAFIPLVFLGLYDIFEQQGKKNYVLTIGAVGLLLSHNISTLLVVLAAIIYVFANLKKLKDIRILKQIGINAIFTVLLVAFFYVPFMQAKLDTDYAIFNERKGTVQGLKEHSITLSQLLFGKMQYGISDSLSCPDNLKNDMCFALGLTIIVPLLFTPIVFSKIEKTRKKLYVVTLITGLGFTLATLSFFPWNHMPAFFAFIQFPWRILLISTFLLSIIAGINIGKLAEKVDWKEVLVITVIAVIYITPLIQITNANGYLDEQQFTEKEKIEKGQQFSSQCATFEYLPSKAFQHMDYIATRLSEAVVLKGNTNIVGQEKNGSNMTFNIQDTQEDTTIELPYIYYPGYTVKLNGNKIQNQESENGFVQITILDGQQGDLQISYTGTSISKVATVISILAGLAFMRYVILQVRKYRKV